MMVLFDVRYAAKIAITLGEKCPHIGQIRDYLITFVPLVRYFRFFTGSHRPLPIRGILIDNLKSASYFTKYLVHL